MDSARARRYRRFLTLVRVCDLATMARPDEAYYRDGYVACVERNKHLVGALPHAKRRSRAPAAAAEDTGADRPELLRPARSTEVPDS